DGERERLQAVAEAGARQLDEILEPGMTVGMAWGTTINAMVSNLRSRPVPGLRIVQLNGAINTEGSGHTYVSTVLARAAALWDATVHHFPVPAFFDYGPRARRCGASARCSGCWTRSASAPWRCSAWAPSTRPCPATSTPTTT